MKNTIYSFLFLVECFLSLFSCKTKENKPIQLYKQLKVSVISDSKIRTLTCKIENNGSLIYYIPKDEWHSCSGDTLYLEAVYKRKNKDDIIVNYNQFNPPILEQLKSSSSFVKKVNYKDISKKTPRYIAVRIFDKPFPYSSKKDYVDYHSLTAFLVFESKNSFLLIEKLDETTK
ncbi:MAG: hypothetical protein JWP44_4990 [Mucilaginibacter sp.]|nr:hypothetical protein [Mucilaginibacter sp.]